jgi:predicted NodU family carbamoyl transferase
LTVGFEAVRLRRQQMWRGGLRVLGLSGLFTLDGRTFPPDLSRSFFHDSAAALVVDGQLLAGVEEERLSRVKHTNGFPSQAIEYCLDQGQLDFRDIDRIAYFFGEDFTSRELQREACRRPQLPIWPAREILRRSLESSFNCVVDPARLVFVPHHGTHGTLAAVESGFPEAMICVADGNGESDSLTLYRWDSAELLQLTSFDRSISLGHFYSSITRFLGFGEFDEYKVMGLAAHASGREAPTTFDPFLRLLPNGRYDLPVDSATSHLLEMGLLPRRKGEPLLRWHEELAAAAQAVVERVVLHVLDYWRSKTGLTRLALAGGVAQNTTMNGAILRSGLFDDVFVHYAAHDGGAAIGAAYATVMRETQDRLRASAQPYLGPSIGDTPSVRKRLDCWTSSIEFDEFDDPVVPAAHLLEQGAVVGWVQGRSEFGPRALGNRSLLADPRPITNRDRINRLLKNRESFRPLAPAVLATRAAEYFDVCGAVDRFSHMGFVVPVRQSARSLLQAVTHADGSARIQTVSPRTNPRFAALLEAFDRVAGVPILLNTSLNNSSEPIVQTVDDVLTLLLTSSIDAVVIDNFLIRRRAQPDMSTYTVELTEGAELRACVQSERRCKATSPSGATVDLGWEEFTEISQVTEGVRRLGELSLAESTIHSLWVTRIVRLRPDAS